MVKKQITATEMVRLSHKSRLKKYGKEGVSKIMKKAQEKSVVARKANKEGVLK